ncbi:unnamed protein product [Oikopleura dioica]|nr:unnamed protein product [Oikopleura dioica]
MQKEELIMVLRLLALGEKKVNLKFQADDNWELAEAGWTMRFQSVSQGEQGDGINYYLWIGNKEGGAKFKAVAEQINQWDGETTKRRELQSEKDETRERVKYRMESNYMSVRFNITIL